MCVSVCMCVRLCVDGWVPGYRRVSASPNPIVDTIPNVIESLGGVPLVQGIYRWLSPVGRGVMDEYRLHHVTVRTCMWRRVRNKAWIGWHSVGYWKILAKVIETIMQYLPIEPRVQNGVALSYFESKTLLTDKVALDWYATSRRIKPDGLAVQQADRRPCLRGVEGGWVDEEKRYPAS